MRKYSAKLLGASLVMAIAVGVSSGPVFAASNAKSQLKAAIQTARCDNMTAKIDNHIAGINNAINKQVVNYQRHETQVTALIAKAKAAGVDTTKAEADLAVWQSKTAAIVSARDQALANFNSAKNLQCATQRAQYRQALNTSKASLASVRALQADKKAYFQSTLKPDLQVLRDQVKNKQ